MMGEHLLMSAKERGRLLEVSKVARGEQRLKDAALKSGLSYRQMRRVAKRYRCEGDKGLCHRSRGRPSNRGKPSDLKASALEF